MLGGAGVALHDHVPVPDSLVRTYGDIDIVVPAKSTRATGATLTALGYEPNERFNALHGARRMLFYDTANGRQLDVFVGSFHMCHELDLGKRLSEHPHALDAADLLLTKLQIAEINRKDVVDAVRLLLTHEVAETSRAGDGRRRCRSAGCATSPAATGAGSRRSPTTWRRCAPRRPSCSTPARPTSVLARIDAVRTALDDAPKSMRWRARSVVGRKTPWYELPEEVDRGAAR